MKHIPVLLNETLKCLDLKRGNFVLDATFGAGGHSEKILEIISDEGKLFAFEKDEKTYEAAARKFSEHKNLFLFNDSYSEMDKYLQTFEGKFDAILFDLGVSSMQLDEAERGFSFKNDGPLDMRFSKKEPFSAQDIVNNFSQEELKRIFYEFGEERFAGKIAKKICQTRCKKKITSTFELAKLVAETVPKTGAKNPATKVFQALRIAVNDELATVEKGINASIKYLKLGGKIAVITFHSLEDRVVKNIFKDLSSDCECPPKMPVCSCHKQKILELMTKKPIFASSEEINFNKRSRSALLRVARKI